MKTETMKTRTQTLVAAMALAFTLSSNSANAVTYTQAPPTGNDTTGAEFLITWNGTHFSISLPSGQGPFDGTEDTLFGVQNNSGAPLRSLTLSGSNIFGLDGDGISFFNGFGPAPGSPGPTGYEGWTSSTSVWGNGTQEAVFFSIVDHNNGVVFFGSSGIAAGGSAYFALEGHTNVTCGPGGCTTAPDSGSTLTLLTMACAAVGLKGRFSKAC